jgi:hypothetical protein
MIRLSLLAAALACLIGGSQAASASTVEYALDTQGASFYDSSSVLGIGDVNLMKADIVKATPVQWLGNGETGFIFGADNGSSQYLTIDLGSQRTFNTVGSLFDIGPGGDRSAQGPFHVQVTNTPLVLASWVDVGASIDLNTVATGPVMLAIASTTAQYVRFFYGLNGTFNNAASGLRASRVYVQNVAATPIPGAILLFGSALGGMGFIGYRRKKLASAA